MSFKALIKKLPLLFSFSFLFLLTSCVSLFFHPDSVDYTAKWEQRKDYLSKSEFMVSKSGNRLNYWVFDAKKVKKPKALIVQFHGNAQNITAQFLSQGWLVDHGYEFLTFDYSGYGKSEGKANIKNVLEDVDSIIEFGQKISQEKKIPYILYGQSLGGALLLQALKLKEKSLKDKAGGGLIKKPCLTIIESSFYSYPRVAQSIANKFWLFWPLQWIPLLTISNKNNPVSKDLSYLAGYKKLVLHAKEDRVVPYTHGQRLFNKMSGDKEFWSYDRGHTSFWLQPERQKKLVDYMDSTVVSCK